MSAWSLTAIGLLVPLIAGVVAAGRGGTSGRLVAVQFTVSLAAFAFLVLDVAFAQPSSAGLALALALLALPGTLVLVLFRERWL